MPISAERAWCDDDTLWVTLSDGRTLGVPLAWFPRLLRATPAALELTPFGLHWDALDEDISLVGLIVGRADATVAESEAAWRPDVCAQLQPKRFSTGT